MPYWLFDVVVLVLPAAVLLLGRPRPPALLLRAVAALAVVALAWTAPWDEHLVRTGVWSYGSDRVLATVGSVPAEEYAFVVLLVVLVAAWGWRTGRLPGRAQLGRGSCAAGALGWLAVALAGAGLLAVGGGSARYLGLLLVWVSPPMALQHAVAGDLLGARRLDRAVVALPVALWLCAADRLALADGVWTISAASSTGLQLLGLPVEEGLFFVLVVLLVTDGLLLATDRRALARARALLPRSRVRSRA